MDLEKSNKARQLEKISRVQQFKRHIAFNIPELDNDDAEKKDSMNMPQKLLFPYLEKLYQKKSSGRENALKILVEELEWNVRLVFAEKNFVTLVHRCQHCLRRGSALEIDLALQLIGLVALTLGVGDNAHEIYEESVVFLPQLLKTKLSHSVKVIQCLSIVTLFGARNFIEKEKSMEIIWNFLNQESKSKVTKYPSSVTAAAISAWALLLSDIDRWSVDHKKWKGLIPYLLKQLAEDDEEVNAASIEALALIFENGSLEKFTDQAEENSSIKDMKYDIINHVKRACNGTKQDASKILEDDYDKTTTLTICGKRLTFSTWSLVKQISYRRRYLGFGFITHMKENKHLQNVFDFVPAKQHRAGSQLYIPKFEKVVVRVFMPDVKRDTCVQRIHMSPNSLLNKERTKLLNKYRMLKKESSASNFIADEELD